MNGKFQKEFSTIEEDLEKARKLDGGAGTIESVSNRERREHLEEMVTTISKELRRAQEKRFSIAFCGMIKAG